MKGAWDSIHVIEVGENKAKANAHYKLTTTVMLSVETTTEQAGQVSLAGSMTRQVNYALAEDNQRWFIG